MGDSVRKWERGEGEGGVRGSREGGGRSRKECKGAGQTGVPNGVMGNSS